MKELTFHQKQKIPANKENFKLFLSLFNFNGEWDIIDSSSRIHAGIEELLEVIEPKEVFERLHGEKNLKSYHSLHEIINENKI